MISRADGHSVLINSYILKASGITKNSPNPFGGEIQKDPVTGEPTGILKENAESLIKPGFLADIVITDKDLLTIIENEIMKTRVDYTITGGKVVYASGRE